MRILFLILCLSLTGCASIFFNDYKQVVKVISDPPGAEIFDKDGKQLGITPAFVKIRRSQKAELKLQSNSGEIKSITLDSHYRWSPSFYGNIVYMSAAPIGWGIDYLTKTAFQLENPERVEFKSNAKNKPKLKPDVLVIAPPQSGWSSLSNEVGVLLQNSLKERYPKKYVKTYEESLPVFIGHHYRYDYREEGEELEKIFYNLDAQEYAESNVEVHDDFVSIEVLVRDAFTKEVKNSFTLDRPISEFKALKRSKWMRQASKVFTFMPNAIGVDFTSYSSNFELAKDSTPNGQPKDIKGVRVSEQGFDQWLNLIGSINIFYVRPPSRGNWHYNFSFVPSLYVSAVTFKYIELEDIADVEFRRFRSGFGYGPQVSASSRYGMFYFSYIPTFNYTKISWANKGKDQQAELGEVLMQAELGYQLFLSNAMAIRIFAKGWNENASRWSNVISNARGFRTNVETSNVSFGGFSLIWYWPGLQSYALKMVN